MHLKANPKKPGPRLATLVKKYGFSLDVPNIVRIRKICGLFDQLQDEHFHGVHCAIMHMVEQDFDNEKAEYFFTMLMNYELLLDLYVELQESAV